MKRIVIIRGEHPNEVSAFYLAPLAVNYLEQLGYQATSVRVPLELTPFGWIRGTYGSFQWIRDFIKNNSEAICFNFHNTPYLSSPLVCGDNEIYNLTGIVVEIPAIFKPMTNPFLLKRINGWPGRPNEYEFCMGPGHVANEFLRSVVDMKASRKHGLVEDLIGKIGRGICEYVEKRVIE